MITLWRVFKTGFRNLFRNAWLSVAATAIMVVTLVIVSFFVFSGLFLNNRLAAIKEKTDITVFLDDTAKNEDVVNLQTKLKSVDNIKSVVYVSKADALKKLEEGDKRSRDIAKTATIIGNPLPASLQVKVKDLSNLDPVNQVFKSDEFSKIITNYSTEEGNDRQKTIKNIAKISRGVSTTGTIIGAAFLIIALLIIFNTVRMAIFTRREEIEIMKLVGATKWFIRGPFIVEGALYGIIGGTLAIIIIFPLINFIKPFFVQYFEAGDVVKFLTDKAHLVILSEYSLGIVLGIISSWLAISRHLKL